MALALALAGTGATRHVRPSRRGGGEVPGEEAALGVEAAAVEVLLELLLQPGVLERLRCGRASPWVDGK